MAKNSEALAFGPAQRHAGQQRAEDEQGEHVDRDRRHVDDREDAELLVAEGRVDREARRVGQVLVEECSDEQGEAFPQDPADASQIKRGEQGKEATRGQPVGDDQHEAGDREGDERGQEQVLGDPVQARPQEGRGEDAREAGFARDVKAARTLEFRVVDVFEGVEDAQECHGRDDGEGRVGVFRRRGPRVVGDEADHDQAGEQAGRQVGAEVEAPPHVGDVEGTHLVQADGLVLLADRQRQGEQAVLSARERVGCARAHDRHAHDDHGQARHEGGCGVPQVVASQLPA